ncbi:MAG: 4-hydroxy-tetrahydrodipicolinate reductase [Leptotrichiaceae bacterium]|nr:4-hydroxy-tetrahydrodipicolinate reductase [Leptotrichiaceae bacterium]
MKVIIYGAGVMANHVKEAVISSGNEFKGFVDPLGNGDFKTLKNENEDYDGIIDFSHFSLLDEILETAVKKKVPLVIATTGHTKEQTEKIMEAAEKIPVIKATNTSVGVTVMNEITAYAAKLLKGFDIEIIEKHHNRKLDAPSGTANTLLEIINKNTDDEHNVVYGREGQKKRTEREIGVHSIRAGNIVGEHTIIFSKNDEIIEIKHEALSRKIFADGAVKGIMYLKDKKPGMYSMKDVLNIK